MRPAVPADAPALGRGMAQVADEGPWLAAPAGTPWSSLAARFAHSMEEGHALFVLEHQARLAGSLGLHPTHAEGVLDLGMWVLAPARGQGGGRRLVQAGLEHAWTRGAHKVQLEVYPENERAIGLYEATGFVVEGVRRDHYRRPDGSLRSAVIMAAFAASD